MTDLEGVAGVRNVPDWCYPDGPHYAAACRLLTEEVNAAVRGLKRAGATRIRVADGHGLGGIDREILSEDVEYFRTKGPNPYPFGIDDGFDVIGWVGQHAKAGTRYAHLPHTGSFNVIDYRINGIAVGEMEQILLCARLFGVEPILAVGDQAFTEEASQAAPGVRTVSVKVGLDANDGAAIDRSSEYMRANERADHRPIDDVREAVEEAAYEGLKTHHPAKRHQSTTHHPWNRSIRLRRRSPANDVAISGEYVDLLTLLNDIVE